MMMKIRRQKYSDIDSGRFVSYIGLLFKMALCITVISNQCTHIISNFARPSLVFNWL